MKWHVRTTRYAMAKRLPGAEQISHEEYMRRLSVMAEQNDVQGDFAGEIVAEYKWKTERRPFFNVWPMIGEALARVTLDLPCQHIADRLMPLPEVMSIQFPVGHEVERKGVELREFLFARMALRDGASLREGVGLVCDCGETDPEQPSWPIYWVSRFYLDSGTVEDAINRPDSNLDSDEQRMVELAVRVLCGISLMMGDQSIVEPIVTKADRDKYRRTGDQKYVDRAHRRGLIGFDVGAHVQSSPHYRRPHFGIRWTGKGRMDPKLVPIKGCVVNRGDVFRVPTGYHDDDE